MKNIEKNLKFLKKCVDKLKQGDIIEIQTKQITNLHRYPKETRGMVQ